MSKQFSGGLFTSKKPQTITPSEANVSKSIEGFLNARKIYNDRLNSGKVEVKKKFFDQKSGKWKEFSNWVQLCRKGTPDRFFIVAGRIYFVEVKQLGKKPSPEQLVKHAELKQHGATVIVADSIENFILQFNALFPDLAQKVFVR